MSTTENFICFLELYHSPMEQRVGEILRRVRIQDAPTMALSPSPTEEEEEKAQRERRNKCSRIADTLGNDSDINATFTATFTATGRLMTGDIHELPLEMINHIMSFTAYGNDYAYNRAIASKSKE